MYVTVYLSMYYYYHSLWVPSPNLRRYCGIAYVCVSWGKTRGSHKHHHHHHHHHHHYHHLKTSRDVFNLPCIFFLLILSPVFYVLLAISVASSLLYLFIAYLFLSFVLLFSFLVLLFHCFESQLNSLTSLLLPLAAFRN